MAREYKIGERFEYLGETFETIKEPIDHIRSNHGTCRGCAFFEMGEYDVLGQCVRPDMLCDKAERSDGTDVKFIAITFTRDGKHCTTVEDIKPSRCEKCAYKEIRADRHDTCEAHGLRCGCWNRLDRRTVYFKEI